MTPEDVRLSLESAGRTLMMLPMPKNGRPAGYGNNWPETVLTGAEWFAQQVAMSAEDRKAAQVERNHVRLAASPKDIRHLDRMLEWLWLIDDPIVRRITFCRSLMYPASGRHVASLRKLSAIFHCNHEHVRNLHYKGLCQISQKMAGIDKVDRIDDKLTTFGQLPAP